MIRIHRPSKVPDILLTKGRLLRDAHIAQYAGGDAELSFVRDVFGNAEVKAALRIAQHDKCGFCESKVSHVASGDVEHFRPKAAFRRHQDDALTRPGYYWLAYEWANLLFACELCNRRHKGSLFPLIDEATRACSASDDIARETPLFIDPTTEDPSTHIGFREEFAYPLGGSARGEATLSALGLNRPDVVERRRDRLQKIRLIRLAAATLRRKRDRESNAVARELEDDLRRSLEDRSEYAALLRCELAAAPSRPRRAANRASSGPRASRSRDRARGDRGRPR